MTPRIGYTDRLIAFITQHEGEWIDAIRFEQFGRQAWRTRISNARKRLEAAGEGTIKNRVLIGARGVKHSQYRFIRLRPATLFDLSVTGSCTSAATPFNQEEERESPLTDNP